MENVPTPHNSAKLGDIARVVIMPGDPLRARYIAKKYLQDVVCYNKVRAMYGYTGMYNNIKISVQGSGMGCPSMGIYSKELYDFYNVDTIIRVGTAGAINQKLNLRDIIIADSSNTASSYVEQFNVSNKNSLCATKELVNKAIDIAKNKNFSVKVGKIYTSDTFYTDIEKLKKLANSDILAVEMETAALYTNAFISNKKAISILSVSDNPITGESLSSTDRENSFNKMIKFALELAILC